MKLYLCKVKLFITLFIRYGTLNFLELNERKQTVFHILTLMSTSFNSLYECLILVFISVFFSFIRFRVEFRVREIVETTFIIEFFHLFLPFLMKSYLVRISVRCIKCLWPGVLEVSWLGALCISCLKMLCALGLCAWNILLKLFLMVTVPVFFIIFANGTIWSPSKSLYLWCCGGTGDCFLLGLWFYLNRGVWSNCRRDWPVLP